MSVLILAEHDGQELKSFTAQLVNAAASWQQSIDLLIYGEKLDHIAYQASQLSGVNRVLKAEANHLVQPLVEDVQDLVLTIADQYSVIVTAHSTFGKTLLPAIAARLDVAPVMDVTSIESPTTYIRPEYAGNIFSVIENSQAQQIISLRTTAFKPAVAAKKQADIISIAVPASRNISRWINNNIVQSDRPELASARVVIAGGRSLGEDFEKLLSPVAEKLDAAIGATRACVDAGFAPNDLQVGQQVL